MNNTGKTELIKGIVAKLKTGCDETEFAAFKCPVCGKALALKVHPNRRSFYLHCPTTSVHLGIHDQCADAPVWWGKYVTGGWLDE
jgi:hypothetical protein